MMDQPPDEALHARQRRALRAGERQDHPKPARSSWLNPPRTTIIMYGDGGLLKHWYTLLLIDIELMGVV